MERAGIRKRLSIGGRCYEKKKKNRLVVKSVKYRVYDTTQKKYVTDEPRWVLKPNGKLFENDYGDEVGHSDCVIEFGSEIPDKDGVEVYEGDIVQIDENVKQRFNIDDGPVIYRGGAFFVGGNDGMRSSLFVIADISYVLRGKVVGNIHMSVADMLRSNGWSDEKIVECLREL